MDVEVIVPRARKLTDSVLPWFSRLSNTCIMVRLQMSADNTAKMYPMFFFYAVVVWWRPTPIAWHIYMSLYLSAPHVIRGPHFEPEAAGPRIYLYPAIFYLLPCSGLFPEENLAMLVRLLSTLSPWMTQSWHLRQTLPDTQGWIIRNKIKVNALLSKGNDVKRSDRENLICFNRINPVIWAMVALILWGATWMLVCSFVQN